ncbi:hypothetical protein GCM10016455_26010 [Aliiroseovarius zhejiangensis]|uniref:Uncharacterized protein n=1 Tax=Aliiroseovarius zhejiangensis TaxID=1632025 RepID=A0ABQ3J843_9RHOB|nr:hypothetical protein [Aliiroseovarius zhejiangensis]GHF03497.1 hypothetical protein GCM10016455_26010 [Aliiroseovarius zhejiangensis]
MEKLDPKLKDRMDSMVLHSHPVQIAFNDDGVHLMDHLNKHGVMVDDNMAEIQLLFADLTSRQIEDLLRHETVSKIALDDDASVIQ